MLMKRAGGSQKNPCRYELVIGRFGVGFKLESLSQAKRIEIYRRLAFLIATKNRITDGRDLWTPSEPNEDGKIFMTYLDLDEIDSGKQSNYTTVEVDDFPEECLVIIGRNLDRLNQRFRGLNTSKRYNGEAPHKLLLLLYALGRRQSSTNRVAALAICYNGVSIGLERRCHRLPTQVPNSRPRSHWRSGSLRARVAAESSRNRGVNLNRLIRAKH
jgi:hypothetical protein